MHHDRLEENLINNAFTIEIFSTNRGCTDLKIDDYQNRKCLSCHEHYVEFLAARSASLTSLLLNCYMVRVFQVKALSRRGGGEVWFMCIHMYVYFVNRTIADSKLYHYRDLVFKMYCLCI